MANVLGLITIGQAPRPDLAQPFLDHVPNADIRLVGALDGLDDATLEPMLAKPGGYPLITRLNSGRVVEVELEALVPRVRHRIDELAAAGAQAVIVLCAGDFPEFKAAVPVLLPRQILAGMVHSLSNSKNIGVVVPVPGQIEAAHRRWTGSGFHVTVTAAAPYDHSDLEQAAGQLNDSNLDLIVLDCLGYDHGFKQAMHRRLGRPIVLAQTAIARAVAELADV